MTTRNLRWLSAPIINREPGHLYFRIDSRAGTHYLRVRSRCTPRARKYWLRNLMTSIPSARHIHILEPGESS